MNSMKVDAPGSEQRKVVIVELANVSAPVVRSSLTS